MALWKPKTLLFFFSSFTVFICCPLVRDIKTSPAGVCLVYLCLLSYLNPSICQCIGESRLRNNIVHLFSIWWSSLNLDIFKLNCDLCSRIKHFHVKLKWPRLLLKTTKTLILKVCDEQILHLLTSKMAKEL